jgi:holliday junction DNA helicase RuvA
MISYLTGKVKSKNADSLTLLVGGVGYLVSLPQHYLAKTAANDNLELYIHTHVRDDALDLYGFTSTEELALFKSLISVSGVGPKTALLVINRGVGEVKQAIIKADESFFTLIPRLGKKNAQKIIIELKSKLGSSAELDLAGDGEPNEAVEALMAMGYTKPEAVSAIRKIPADIKTVEEQLRYALKRITKHD